MKNCDIIVPVFNSFHFLIKCIESVLINTDLNVNRLIVIDDKSTDERIVPFLEALITNEKLNIVFIKNEENLGFVKTVNNGMRYSDNDVLLLNSNTEVTKNWLEKIQKCAYIKEKVATVTPLSNDAGIVSVPLFQRANKIPNGYDLNEYQMLIDRISYKEYPEIPMGISFCMYIRREALNVVGFFDEEAYGEEEYFCYRCLSHGYKHILCDDVIIYHDASQSISGYYLETLENKKKTLKNKYSFYKSNTKYWVYHNSINYINKNINYNICINNGKSNVLIIIHSWDMQLGNNKLVGGTSYHVYDIIKILRNKYNFHVLIPLPPYNGMYSICSYWEGGEETLDIVSLFSQYYNGGFFNSGYSIMLKNIIDIFKINIIHIHHMMYHYFDLVNILKNEKIKLFISLHDYFSICPRINKVTKDNLYCGHWDEAKCNSCLSSFNKIEGINNIEAWNSVWNLLFSYANKIIAPSEAAKREVSEVYNHLSIDVVEHGIDTLNDKKELDIDTDKEFHVAFLGGISVIKGKKLIEELIKYSRHNKDGIFFHLFGNIDQNIRKMKCKNFIYHGEYDRNELNKLFKVNNIKLICIFSIWPETYSYTLTESVSNNIPLLAIDLGAVGQRIKENNLGWLIKNGTDISEIYKKIKDIFCDKIGYKTVSKSILNYKIKNLEEMCNEYDNIYSSYKADKNKSDYTEKTKIFIKENYFSIPYKICVPYSLHIRSAITWFPRNMKRFIQSCFKYGIRFTIVLIINKILRKNIITSI